MERLTKADIRRALEALAAALPPSASTRELKARYAFDDLWEADRGSP
jgi:hypothetical protein